MAAEAMSLDASTVPYLKKEGVVIVNSTPVKPTTEALQETGYDGTEMIAYLKKKADCVILDGEALLKKAGSARCFNMIVLGALAASGRLEIPTEILIEEMEHQPVVTASHLTSLPVPASSPRMWTIGQLCLPVVTKQRELRIRTGSRLLRPTACGLQVSAFSSAQRSLVQ